MALFKKKKEEEPKTGMGDGIGLTGSLAESKKSGLFSKKKEQRQPESPREQEPASAEVPKETSRPEPPTGEEETIECPNCGMICPAGTAACEICDSPLTQPEPELEDARELEEEEMPSEPAAEAPLEPEETTVEPASMEAIPEPIPEEVLPPELASAGTEPIQDEELPAEQEPDIIEAEALPEEPEPQLPAAEPRPSMREDIPIQLEMAEEKPKAPAWKPLPDKERKAAEKAIKRDVKDLDKQLKRVLKEIETC
jgi:hypothetical protein